MQSSHLSTNESPLATQSPTCETRLRYFLMWVLLAGIIFNIISWGGVAGFVIWRQSGGSFNWREEGGIPILQFDGSDIRQTVPPDATLPPTPLDITSVGQPSSALEDFPTPTTTEVVENTPVAQPDTPPTTPLP
ncbi:MAG: hypothetical protein JXB07_21855 [Anaerolineae bacterium]|nr:hypothetical protein [Anaerolineae bacterium]